MSTAATSRDDELERVNKEQSRCRDWMAENGYPQPLEPQDNKRTPQQLAGMGATDWVMESVLILYDHDKSV